jgi:hypothetical protein
MAALFGLIQPPGWVTQPDVSRAFKIYVDPSTSSLPRALVFFEVKTGPSGPPLNWFVERQSESGWVGIGVTAGSAHLRNSTSNGVTALPDAEFDIPFGEAEVFPGDVLSVLFDTRGLFPNSRYRFSSLGMKFETTIRTGRYPPDLPDQTGADSPHCKRKTDRFLPGTIARRFDNNKPTKWENVQGKKCGSLIKGTYAVKGKNAYGLLATSYYTTKLLK